MVCKSNFYNSIDCDGSVVMWSSVVLFVLTFAVFGLLLGFAAVFDTNQERQTSDGVVIRQNVSDNATQGSQSSSPAANEESG
jgi:hypothetical protein